MKSIFISVVLLVFLSELDTSVLDSGFDECFATYNGVKYVEYICTDEKNPASKRECAKDDDKSKVYVLKYRCNQTIGTLRIKKDAFNRFDHLRHVDISSLNTSQISLPLGRFENIEIFNASHNYLVEMMNLIFNRMPNLTELDLSYNIINKLFKTHFNGSHQLSKVNFSHNAINHLDIGVFSTLPNLETLDLSHNKIESISENLLKENKQLKILHLNNNPMKIFNFKMFSSIVMTMHLPAINIKTLNIDCDPPFDCHFDDFNDDDYFENITTFRASSIQFKNLSKILSRFGRSLEVLNVTQSFIGTLSSDMMERFSDLKEFTMTRASISKIDDIAFSYPTKLITLDLSYNKLMDVDTTIFRKKFFDLIRLNLDGNRLIRINNVNPTNLPKLESLSILNNWFSCDYLSRFLKRWNKHNIAMSNNSSNVRDNINGIDCINETLTNRNVVNTNYNEEKYGEGRASSDFSISTDSKYPSTLPYIVIIIALCVIIMVFITSAIFCHLYKQKNHGKLQNLIKTDTGVQTMEEIEHFQLFDPNKTNNDFFYEEIELKSLSSSETDTKSIQNRPLPTPPMENKYLQISNGPMPIEDQYASAVKKRDCT